jgi:adenine C2-methylase RlmN of 23S rRNA A2503 and tRNA A37
VESLPDIKSLGREGLGRAVHELGQPAWRASQIVRWLYQRGVASFAEMTDLPAALRDELTANYSLGFPAIVDRQVSADGTRKYRRDRGPAGRRATHGVLLHPGRLRDGLLVLRHR